MIRTVPGMRSARARYALLIVPAMVLAGCQDSEAQLAERNAAVAAAARKADAARDVQQEQRELAQAENLQRQETYSEFYGHEGEGDEKKGKAKTDDEDVSADEPDFLDPTSDHFDNTYVVPEPAEMAETSDASVSPNETDL